MRTLPRTTLADRGGRRLGGIASLLVLALATSGSAGARSAGEPVLRSVTTAHTAKAKVLRLRRPAARPGDLLLAVVDVRTASVRTIIPPLGWRLVRSDTVRRPQGALTQAVYRRVARSREPAAYTWRLRRAHGAVGAVLAYAGDGSSPSVVGHRGTSASGVRRIRRPAIPRAAESRIVAFIGATGRVRVDPGTGMRKRYEVSIRSGRERITAAAAEASGRAAGTAALSHRVTGAIVQLVALRSRPGTQPPPRPKPTDCPTLSTPTPVPGYCSGKIVYVTPSSFGSGVFGPGGIAVSPGDVVVFEDGIYTDRNGDGAVMRIRARGTASRWITFVSRTRWGAHMWGNDNRAAEGISLDGADYVRVEGFEISDVGNVGSPRGSSSGIDLYNGGKRSHLVGNHIHHVGRVCANPRNTNGQVGIFVQTGKSGGSIIVENNLIHDIGRLDGGGCGYTRSLDHGMYLNGSGGGGGGASNVTIRNNVFHDTHRGWGVQWYPGSLDDIHVLNNTFAFCNESKNYTCIVLDASISNSSIKNNVFYNPQGGKTIEAEGFRGSITIGNNLTSGSAMHDQGSTPGGMRLVANLLNTNARLMNPPRDFHLAPGSPAIDRGENLSSVTVDHDGRGRPAGSAHDIGAFEYGG